MIIKPEAQNGNQLAHTKGNFMCCEENPLNEKPRKIMYITSNKTETIEFFLDILITILTFTSVLYVYLHTYICGSHVGISSSHEFQIYCHFGTEQGEAEL